MENRRLQLRDGRVADVRRAYSLPPENLVEGAGPIDPEIGLMRLERMDGTPLAVVLHFACHPIQGVPDGGNTADLSGFAVRVIEEQLGDGVTALFLQGCAADVNPILYRDVDRPPDAEPLGTRLGLSALKGMARLECSQDNRLALAHRVIRLPRADLSGLVGELEREQARLLENLKPTMLNLKSFLPLLVKHRLSPEYPSYDAHLYLHQASLRKENLRRLDAENRLHLDDYIHNIHTMEELTRLRVNLNLLRTHEEARIADGTDEIETEVVALRIGAFVLVAFPGELPVELGQRIKGSSPHPHTFVSGVTNGYLYYTPTLRQLANRGGAQEDSDCLVSEAWEPIFTRCVAELLDELAPSNPLPGT